MKHLSEQIEDDVQINQCWIHWNGMNEKRIEIALFRIVKCIKECRRKEAF